MPGAVKEPLYQQRAATQQLTSQVMGWGYRHLQALTQIRALIDAPAEQQLARIDALLLRHRVTAAQLSEDHQQLEQPRLATEQQAGEALFPRARAPTGWPTPPGTGATRSFTPPPAPGSWWPRPASAC